MFSPLQEIAGEIRKFTLERKHNVFFLPAGKSEGAASTTGDAEAESGENPGTDLASNSSDKLTQMVGACAVPVKLWDSHATKVLWLVRWTKSGLMPIRPAVYFVKTATVPEGKALCL